MQNIKIFDNHIGFYMSLWWDLSSKNSVSSITKISKQKLKTRISNNVIQLNLRLNDVFTDFKGGITHNNNHISSSTSRDIEFETWRIEIRKCGTLFQNLSRSQVQLKKWKNFNFLIQKKNRPTFKANLKMR